MVDTSPHASDGIAPGADDAGSKAPTKRELVWVMDRANEEGQHLVASVLEWVLTGRCRPSAPASGAALLHRLHGAFLAAQPDPDRWADGDEVLMIHHGELVERPALPLPPAAAWRRDHPGRSIFEQTHKP